MNSARGGYSCEVTGRSVPKTPSAESARQKAARAKRGPQRGLNDEKFRGGATEVVGPRGPQGPEQEFGEKRDAPSGATEVDVTRMSGPAEDQTRRDGALGRLRAKRAARGPRP